jgi:DNA adenine methylase
MAAWIIRHFPPHEVYVEPFAGSASVLLQKQTARTEVLNDLNGRIVSAFRVLRDPAMSARLKDMLQMTPCSIVEYLAAREVSPDPIEDARRLIILGHQSHGSTGASGKKSGWRRGLRPRGPASANEWASLHEAVMAWADRLRATYLECNPAIAVIAQWDSPQTLHYVDPPYVATTRANGLSAYTHEMTDNDHRDLAETLHKCVGMVVLSGYPCELYDWELYPGWHRVYRSTVADKQKPTTEVLWMNEAAVRGQGQAALDFAR